MVNLDSLIVRRYLLPGSLYDLLSNILVITISGTGMEIKYKSKHIGGALYPLPVLSLARK